MLLIATTGKYEELHSADVILSITALINIICIMSKSMLLLFAHPAQSHSNINLPLFERAKRHSHVTAVDLYSEYQRSHINVKKEQQRLIEHDVVIMQFPFYWYSTPAILKHWQDLVLQYGFAFGKNGTALHEKPLLCALSTGAPEHAYTAEGANGFTIRELLRPLEATAHLCGMPYLPPFVLHGGLTAHEDGRLQQHSNLWQTVLDQLAGDEINLNKADKHNTLNEYLLAKGGSSQ